MAVRLRPNLNCAGQRPLRQNSVHQRSTPLPTSRVARVRISSMHETARHSSKPLSSDRVTIKLPEGWTRRRIEVTETNNNHLSKKLQSKRERLLDYEEYKLNFLKNYDEFKRESVEDFLKSGNKIENINWKKVERSYEIYCKTSYNSYKIEYEQDSPGFII